MNEYDTLIRQLQFIAERPGMYGNPESAESTSKNITHVLFQIKDSKWIWSLTEQVWQDTASQLGYGIHLVPKHYESVEYRQQKWGSFESTARAQIQVTYSEIWEAICKICTPYKVTSNWVEFILEQPSILGSPDNLDIVLWSLINTAAPTCDAQFKKIYEKKCISLRGSSVNGLRNLMTKAEWNHISKPIRNNDASYEKITKGIHSILIALSEKVPQS